MKRKCSLCHILSKLPLICQLMQINICSWLKVQDDSAHIIPNSGSASNSITVAKDDPLRSRRPGPLLRAPLYDISKDAFDRISEVRLD